VLNIDGTLLAMTTVRWLWSCCSEPDLLGARDDAIRLVGPAGHASLGDRRRVRPVCRAARRVASLLVQPARHHPVHHYPPRGDVAVPARVPVIWSWPVAGDLAVC